MNYKLRILTNEEYEREDLKKIFADNNSKVPQPEVSNIAVAENEEGRIIGFYVLQPIYHAEPIWIDPEVNLPNLHKELMDVVIEPLRFIKGLVVYVFAPNKKIANLAKRFGFKELDYKVLEQRF